MTVGENHSSLTKQIKFHKCFYFRIFLGGEGVEEKGEREFQAGSMFSTEPDLGLDRMTLRS